MMCHMILDILLLRNDYENNHKDPQLYLQYPIEPSQYYIEYYYVVDLGTDLR